MLMAFDANYAPHAAACMTSLVRHSSSRFEFVITSTDDPAAFSGRLCRSFASNDRVSIRIARSQVPTDTHFPLPYTLTLETYLRLWADELLPGRDRVLYLDPDTIVTTAIDPLWETDLEGKVLAAVPIPGSNQPDTHGMPPGSPFFNAGVLLIDLAAWRARGYRDRCLDYLRRHPERALDGDQDILNLVTIGDWLPLDYEWNVISPFYRPSHDLHLAPAVVRRVCDNARIIHFNGSNKPWTYLGEHPRKADYLSNLASTDWSDWRPADRTPINRVRKRVGKYLPPWAKQTARKMVRAGQLAVEKAVTGVPTHV
ncbi:MAG: glycosyltransferase family 8 protein [Acetobacteraceae bacterium]